MDKPLPTDPNYVSPNALSQEEHMAIVHSLLPGKKVMHLATGRTGVIDRCEGSGVVHVWFGALRGPRTQLGTGLIVPCDGARVCEEIHYCDLDPA